MTNRDTNGLTPQDRVRKTLCAKIDTEMTKLPNDHEAALTLTYVAAYALRLAAGMTDAMAEEANT